jgi:hypothetical protein
METARIFLTDYNSYNNGTQFEFGHWIELSDFEDETELMKYIKNHFKYADKKSPIDGKREEIMITDYEGFPRELYSESMNEDAFREIYEFLNLEEREQTNVVFLMEEGYEFEDAMKRKEDIWMIIDEGRKTHWHLFDELYPDMEEIETKNPYIEINYDHFIKENFTNFNWNGVDYLVYNNY